MSQQSKALLRLCQSLWRIGGHSSSRVSSVDGHAVNHVRRWSSSFPRCPSSQPALSLFHLNTKGAASYPRQESQKTGAVAIGNQDQKYADQICSTILDLSLLDADENSSLKWSFSEKSSCSTSSHELTPSSKHSLACWPHGEHLEYICPSEKLITLPDLAILDHLPTATAYDLPHTLNINPSIIDPTATVEISEPTAQNETPKEARAIMKIRRKKMKRHLLKKFRKRMVFTLRKIRRAKQKKKEAAFRMRLTGIKDWGESFSAQQWAQDELDKARKGGFYINVLGK